MSLFKKYGIHINKSVHTKKSYNGCSKFQWGNINTKYKKQQIII